MDLEEMAQREPMHPSSKTNMARGFRAAERLLDELGVDPTELGTVERVLYDRVVADNRSKDPRKTADYIRLRDALLRVDGTPTSMDPTSWAGGDAPNSDYDLRQTARAGPVRDAATKAYVDDLLEKPYYPLTEPFKG